MRSPVYREIDKHKVHAITESVFQAPTAGMSCLSGYMIDHGFQYAPNPQADLSFCGPVATYIAPNSAGEIESGQPRSFFVIRNSKVPVVL